MILKEDPHGGFVERDADGAELSVDHGYYHAADTVTVFGSGFAVNAEITITISDPEEYFALRTVSANSDELGSFKADFVADPEGNLDTHIVEASDGRPLPGRATRSCVTTIRPQTRPPAMSCGRTGLP